MNSDRTKRFRYSLDPFLKKRKLDWAAVKIEESQAKAIVERREKEAASIQGAIGDVEQRYRESMAHGVPIDRDRHQNMSQYLKHRRRDLVEKRKQVEQASKVHEQINSNLNTIRQGIKALEKHKANKRDEHARGALRHERDQLDELWLLRNGRQSDVGIIRAVKRRNGGGNNGS